jgi:DNA-binding XRE family transcriptional regulator
MTLAPLVQYLAQPGHSQSRLALETGVNPSTICRILSGKAGCSLLVALKIDAATGGAVRAEAMVTEEEAALVGRLRATAPAP